LPQKIEGIALCREMTAQTSAGDVPDLEFLDRYRIVQGTLVEIAQCLVVTIELPPIESSGMFEHCGRIDCSDL
jgi:hypothetical protein